MVIPGSEARSLLGKMPPVRRAREYYLYDSAGRRYLDLYQDGGRAWLGHRPEGVSLQLKNTLSRGCSAAYPSFEQGKLRKAALALAASRGGPEWSFFAYHRRGTDGEESLAWHPSCPWPGEQDMVEMEIPLPGFDYGRVLVGRRPMDEGDIPSPVVAAALTRTIWTLKNALESETAGALPFFASSLWRQEGGRLYWREGGPDYGDYFQKALENGILIAPDPGMPSYLPRLLSPADLKLLEKLFKGDLD